MPLFWKPYTSDVTSFIEQLKAKQADAAKKNSARAAPCCGTSASTATPQAENAKRGSPQQPYVYQTKKLSAPSFSFRRERRHAGPRRARAARAPATGACARAGEPSVVDGVAVARLYGEPLFAMPTDLYIPPDALEVFLEAFEGPLDLLLYLIRRQNFNILDIPLASVTRQYLDLRRADPQDATSNSPANTC